jgi:hypothetical protein
MTIEINGTTYPLRASMGAWRKFEQATGIKVAQVGEGDITRIPEMIYYFIQAGCKYENKKFTMSVDDFLDLVTIDDVTKMSEVITELLSIGDKKKVTAIEV